jgi:hypothetical protein
MAPAPGQCMILNNAPIITTLAPAEYAIPTIFFPCGEFIASTIPIFTILFLRLILNILFYSTPM